MVSRLAYASPALLLQGILDDLAGTSLSRYRRFSAQVDAFQEIWRGFVEQRLFADQLLRAADLDALPRFTFQEEDSAPLLLRVAQPLLFMLVALTLLLLLTRRRLRAADLTLAS